ncbi:MAG: hypothetical protein O3B01_25400 [Planctomycetota bacterium]|nr:hypothetical protein [Planctomycetota bacterium]
MHLSPMLCFLLLSLWPLHAEQSPNIHGETIEETATRTGYTVDEIREWFPPIEVWQTEFGVKTAPEAGGYAKERFRKPPGPYVHPRILINPEDLPEIRRRIKETKSGQVTYEALNKALTELHKQEVFGRLVDGTIGDLRPKDIQAWIINGLACEALICLIDQDESRGKGLATAITSFARLIQSELPGYSTNSKWWEIIDHVRSDTLGLAYDFGYAFMTGEQRTLIRNTISALTKNKTHVGLEQLPSLPITNDWFTNQAGLMTLTLAIEGEEGFNQSTYLKFVEAFKRWVFVGSSPNGVLFSGPTRNAYSSFWLIPLAKRGVHLLGTSNAKNHVGKYSLHTMIPWGIGKFVFDTGINFSRPLDPQIIKYAFPNDPAIDLVYLNSVGSKYEHYQRAHFGGGIPNYASMYYLLFGLDFEREWDESMSEVAKTEPLTFYDDFQGTFVTRDEWKPNATHLVMQSHHLKGTHGNRDRNNIVFSSHGRVWLNRDPNVFSGSEWFSVVLADSAQTHSEVTQSLALVDTKLASFHSSDARWCYRSGSQESPVPFSMNDSRLEKGRLPWMSLPKTVLPDWRESLKSGAPGFSESVQRWRGQSAEFAIRTAGLIRGSYPYVLVTDDLQIDDKPHIYEWQVQLADDAELERIVVGKESNGHLIDFVFREAADPRSDSQRDRKLLLRVLDAGQTAQERMTVQTASRMDRFVRFDHQMARAYKRRIMLPMRSVVGRFKVLLFPFRSGEVLPQTQWNETRTRLQIEWAGQLDEINFTPRQCGSSEILVRRKRGELIGQETKLMLPDKPLVTDSQQLASVQQSRAWLASKREVEPKPKAEPVDSPILSRFPVLKKLHPNAYRHFMAGPDEQNPEVVKLYDDKKLTPAHSDWTRLALYGLEGEDEYRNWLRGERGPDYHSRIATINLSHWEGSYQQLRFINVRQDVEKAAGTPWGKGKTLHEIGVALAANLDRFIDSFFAIHDEWREHDIDQGALWNGRWVSYNDGHLRVVLSPLYLGYVEEALKVLVRGKAPEPQFVPRVAEKYFRYFRDYRRLPPGMRVVDTADGKQIIIWFEVQKAKLLEIQNLLGQLLKLDVTFEDIQVEAPIDPADNLTAKIEEAPEENVEVDIPLDVEERKKKEPKLYTFKIQNIEMKKAIQMVGEITGNDCELVGHRVIFRKPVRLKYFDVSTARIAGDLSAMLMASVKPSTWDSGTTAAGITRKVAFQQEWAGRNFLAVNADAETMKSVNAFMEKAK